MGLKTDDYRVYSSFLVEQIPVEKLMEIVIEFSINAIFQMGASVESSETKRIVKELVYMLKDKFAGYPLYLVSEAFDMGSLGQLGGTSKFIKRNVFIWLSSMEERNLRLKQERWSNQENNRRGNEEKEWKDNRKHNIVFGTALSIKLTWINTNLIKMEDWDLYPLGDIVKCLKEGESEKTIRPSMIRK
jgi:hypothetical protein